MPQYRLGTYDRPAFAIAGLTAQSSLPDPGSSLHATEAVFRWKNVSVCMVLAHCTHWGVSTNWCAVRDILGCSSKQDVQL